MVKGELVLLLMVLRAAARGRAVTPVPALGAGRADVEAVARWRIAIADSAPTVTAYLPYLLSLLQVTCTLLLLHA